MSLLQRMCKHDLDFVFLRCEAADRLPGVWACGCGCGFSMNFDPELFPNGIAYVVRAEGKTLKFSEGGIY